MATIDLTAGWVYLGYCLRGWVGMGGVVKVRSKRTEPQIVSTFNGVKSRNKEQRSCLFYCEEGVTTDFQHQCGGKKT